MKKLIGISCLLLTALALPAVAQDYPSKAVTLVVPFTAGTGIDNLARAFSERQSRKTGQAYVVENKVGVAGNLGAAYVAHQPGDGYTLLVTSNNLTINNALYKNMKFDARTDLVPLAIGAWGSSTLVINPALPIRTVAELVAYAKANPDKLSYASAGVGSPMHIQFEQFEAATGTKFVHVPYKGTAPAIADLIGGHADVGFIATHSVAQTVKAGQLRALAVGAAERSKVLPDVRTFKEEGFSDFRTDMWYGFLAPKGTSPALVTKISQDIADTLAVPEIKASLEKTGLEVRYTAPDKMETVLNKEYTDFAKIISTNNIQIN
ncbi:tripartite tricarboxylate transporter substrate binding protein [Xylophilus sp. GOD-11R]|uniref:Bug family tripartite tricarboxylate transporter substrate binding protein n=1 Tax=Xylophilus sp. GOD-11R TaxID=3089814 RepID=UPI00298C143A|nr:tripartite tricarboxylate transporter substrate binding protein [Xylophilus sp. GOD-11R]WPB57177.1 tripartite tricarboxylate transporter substrate binding protein [Xylophilus sp. GOD-11R]